MSPTTVDLRTQTTNPTMQAKRSSLPQNPNPKGNISSSSSSSSFTPHFGISSNNISSNRQQQRSSQIDSETINPLNLGSGDFVIRNANEGSFVSYSVLPSVFEKPVSRTTSGLSTPRFVKVRKHSSSHKGRSGSASQSESQLDSDFNPFCPVSEDSDIARESNGLNSSGGSTLGNFGLGKKSDDVGFVFGASRSGSVSNLNLGNSGHVETRGTLLPDVMSKLNIGSETECMSGKDAAFNTGERINLKSDEASEKFDYVFGFNSQKNSGLDGNMESKLPEEMRKLNIESSGKGDGVEKIKDANLSSKGNAKNTFIFGRSRNVESKLQDKMKKLNIKDFENAQDTNSIPRANDKDSFGFGTSEKDVDSLGRSSASTLPNEMEKLNIVGSGIDDGVEKVKVGNFKVNEEISFDLGSKDKKSDSFSGSTANMLPDEMMKLNIGNRNEAENTKVGNIKDNEKKTFVFGNSSAKFSRDPVVGKAVPTPFTFQTATSSESSRMGPVPSVQPNNDSKLSEASFPSPSLSSAGLVFESVGNVFEEPSMGGNEKKSEFSFRTPHMDIQTPKQDASFTGNLFAGLNKKLEFSTKRGAVKDTGLKKRRGQMRQPASVHQWAGQSSISMKNSFQENPESSPKCYSPMDYSPYQETLAVDQSSRETSVASDEYSHFDSNYASTDARPSVYKDATQEELVTATHCLDINKDDPKCGEFEDEGSMDHVEGSVGDECPLRSETEEVDIIHDDSVAATETTEGCSSNLERKESDDMMQFCFAPSSEDVGVTNFTFAASTSNEGNLSATKRHYRKKNRMKVGQDSGGSSSMQFIPLSRTSLHLGSGQSNKGDSSISQSIGENKLADKEPEVKQGSISINAASSAAQEACEKWRLRGNQAYGKGDLSKSEDYYTRGVNCVSPNETSESCLRALALCYSNRAAARMSAGRIREALEDCTKAATLDPNLPKVQVRAANCYLVLGEIEDALKYFKKCLPSGGDVCLDRKFVIEASNGQLKAQRVAEYLDRCAELLLQRTSNDAESALQIITEALSISPYSDKLVEMKAEALFMLRKYEEVIQVCEQSLDSAEKNSASVTLDGQFKNLDCSESIKNSPSRLWRSCLIAKSYFYLGRLEEALDILDKLVQAVSAPQKYGSETLKTSISLAVTVRELLRHKAAGNEAFLSGRHSEAIEHYTSALSCNIESRPFAAICFCNRAAAHKDLGQITDAIADSSLAIALDGNYVKAISRRATLHEMIRDYGQAARDLQRLIPLLEKQTEVKVNQNGTLSISNNSMNDLNLARTRLSTMEEQAKKGIPLDMYLILGIEPSGTVSDIKKAYRKAALRHHPDKAGQFLARSENGDEGMWKEIAEEVHKDADRLFKMVGEAYAVLSDPAKRSRYDVEEEMRNIQKNGNGSSTSRASSDVHNNPFERSSRRQWQEVYRSYGNQRRPWSEASQSHRYS